MNTYAYTQNEWSSGFCSREGIKFIFSHISELELFFSMLGIRVVLFSLGRGKGVDPPEFWGMLPTFIHFRQAMICVWGGGGWAGVERHDNMYRHYQPLENVSSLCGHQIFGDLGGSHHQNPLK